MTSTTQNPNNLSTEKLQLRDWFYLTGKSNGYKAILLQIFFGKHREKPLSELKEILEGSKYVGNERIELKDWFYSTGKANGYSRDALKTFFAKHREKPLSELKEILEGSKYVGNERIELRDCFYSTGKANGYGGNDLRHFFAKHREKPLSELREILEGSKYVTTKKENLSDAKKALRDEFLNASKEAGWAYGEYQQPTQAILLFAKHKDLPINELREVLFSSKYAKPNPTRYLIFSALMEVIDPYKEQIGQALLPYCNFIRGLGDHKESEAFYLKKIVEDLKQFIPDEVAVEAFVYHHLRPVTHRGDVA